MAVKKLKEFNKKLIISLLLVAILSSSVFTNISYASVFGNTLIQALFEMLASIGDVAIYTVQHFMMDTTSHNYAVFFELDKEDDVLKTYKQIMGRSSNPDAAEEGYFDVTDDPDVIITGGRSIEKDMKFPVFKYTPEEIFKNEVPIFSINFLNPEQPGPDATEEEVKYYNSTLAGALHEAVATWYVSLRNLGAAVMLCILVYAGIRMLTSTTAKQGAKYQSMLMDWLVGMLLLFFIHYFMIFMISLTDNMIKVVAGGDDTERGRVVISLTSASDQREYRFKTNMMGLGRYLIQFPSAQARTRLSYLIIYLGLIGFTIYFTGMYLKRALMVLFLILLAPVVMVLYPLEKINGKGNKAFKMWFQEFFYNCLIQPYHLLIFSIFMGVSYKLAANPIYVLSALFFLIPAEKFLRGLLGFKGKKVGSESAAMAAFGAFVGKKISGNISKASKSLSEKTKQEIKNREIDHEKEDEKEEAEAEAETGSSGGTGGGASEAAGEAAAETGEAAGEAAASAGEAVGEAAAGVGEAVGETAGETGAAAGEAAAGAGAVVATGGAAIPVVIAATVIKGAAKVGAMTAGALVGASVGLMTSAMRGDSDPTQEIFAGGAAGAALGKRIADGGENFMGKISGTGGKPSSSSGGNEPTPPAEPPVEGG